MRDIYFHCPRCAKALAADSASQGEAVACVDCGERLIVPRPTRRVKCFCGNELLIAEIRGLTHKCLQCGAEITSDDAADRASSYEEVFEKPRLSRDVPEHTHRCPRCGESLRADVVICAHCGYDLRTGRRVGRAWWFFPTRRTRVLVRGGLLAALCALLIVYRAPLGERIRISTHVVKQAALRGVGALQQLWGGFSGSVKVCEVCRGQGMVTCLPCEGSGMVEVADTKTCDQCGGTGKYRRKMAGSKKLSPHDVVCPFCRGTGSTRATRHVICTACEGSGQIVCTACDGRGHVRTSH